jgi:hypothetical protein
MQAGAEAGVKHAQPEPLTVLLSSSVATSANADGSRAKYALACRVLITSNNFRTFITFSSRWPLFTF